MKMKNKIYKVRLNCSSFKDVVIRATSKEEAIREAIRINGCDCPQTGMEFGEFLEVGKSDEIEN